MNLLAHALLSGAGTEVRLGNLLADFVKGRDRRAMPAGFLQGVRQHQVVDRFTDLHPIFHQSKSRIKGYPHVTGILIDVFYDHFLTLSWNQYVPEPLGIFTARLYAQLSSHQMSLPSHGQDMLDRIINHDLLGTYATVEGIQETLTRIGQHLEMRIGKDFGLSNAATALVANFDHLERDFAAFFPLLQSRSELFQRVGE